MTANIRVCDEFGKDVEIVEILEKPFQINGIRLFVYLNEFSKYVITEWQSGGVFIRVKTKPEIRSAINHVFAKRGIEKIKQVIQDNVIKYGIANEEPV